MKILDPLCHQARLLRSVCRVLKTDRLDRRLGQIWPIRGGAELILDRFGRDRPIFWKSSHFLDFWIAFVEIVPFFKLLDRFLEIVPFFWIAPKSSHFFWIAPKPAHLFWIAPFILDRSKRTGPFFWTGPFFLDR